MGMYDQIICKYPLDGGLPSWIGEHPFQTKDLDCRLDTYTINEDGTFSLEDFSGAINFYSSNIVGTGPGIYTSNGEDAESISCVAIFLHGKLTDTIEVQRESEPAWPSSRQHNFTFDEVKPRTEDEQQKRYHESMIGKRFYVLYGGQEKGYWVKVIAENDRELCFSHESEGSYYLKGSFEIMNRGMRDHIFWDSEEEALQRKTKQESAWKSEKQAFEVFQVSKKLSEKLQP